jgi:hypothetical protein
MSELSVVPKNEKHKYEPPKAEASDKALAVVRAVTGSIPLAGNAVNELMPLFFTAPLEKRRQAWMNQIAEALYDLKINQGVNLDQLQSDERFISVLVQASQVAMRNHQQEKIQALRHAVSNSASGIKIEDDLQLLFIRFVDELTPSHFSLLRFFRDHETTFENMESYEQLFEAFGRTHTQISRDEFRLICEELKARNLVRISDNLDDFAGVASHDYIIGEQGTSGPVVLVTEIGNKMLEFISAHGLKAQ